MESKFIFRLNIMADGSQAAGDHGVGQTELIAAGSRSHNIFKLFSGSKEVLSSIKLALQRPN